MRIRRLTLAGFGPYKNEQSVDFDRFRDDGIFLITGKTGAGKSSILDAICYALYAGVPRYEGTQQQLRSDHCDSADPSFVELEFTVNGIDYRVHRTPEFERPKQRGTGTTKQAATAELSERVGDTWVGRSARAVDVARDLDRILGLSKDQFLQVILLAQNRFQKFLKANNEERQGVLRSLFGTERFEQLEDSVAEMRKALDAELAGALALIQLHAQQAAALLRLDETPTNPPSEWFRETLGALVAERDEARLAALSANAAVASAEEVYRALAELARMQKRRDGATATLATLADRQAQTDTDRLVVDAARRAAVVWPHLALKREADDTARVARTTEATARERYLRAPHPDHPADRSAGNADDHPADRSADHAADHLAEPVATLEVTIDELTRELGVLEQARAEEAELPALAAATGAALRAAERVETEFAEASTLLEELPGQIDAVNDELSEVRITASRQGESALALERAQRRLEAARLADTLAHSLRTAEANERECSAAHLDGARALDELLDRRLTGHAAELATALVDGEPCLVCGSHVHPAPSTHTSTPVSEGDILSARTALATLRSAMDSAHAATQTVATHRADAQARADDTSVGDCEQQLRSATAVVASVAAAGQRQAQLEAQLLTLRAELAAARESVEARASSRSAAARHLAEAQAAERAVTERVAQHRRGSATVAERMAPLRRRLDAARALLDARAQTSAREATLAHAAAVLATQLAEHAFSHDDQVVSARLPASEMARREQQIRDHEQASAAARATLAEAALVELPAEPVQVEVAADALAAARLRRDDALATQNSLDERCIHLQRIVTEALAQQAGSAKLRHEGQQLRELSSALQGQEPNTKRMRLETYVLAAQLEEIVAAANARLRTMTSGRFTLEHDDSLQYRKTQSGLGLRILDEHTGRSRATHSLSGGETFLASLALALGLAEVVTNQAGGITLDTLFIDEGFGSLDHDTLEIAMGTLDGLRAGGRTIGLISHVDTMKEQIPAKLQIRVTDRGDSEIEEQYSLE
ncbi:exonuclease SbcC [Glaciihabitans tibetensis]|uniref:Nuclease SbcCD subunit C n=1 Tax=Glaciihabitans tibetensis TaxID=1266600 RepID=A0A2T0VK54_9MICO|nr:AAA family ATPase [Glaciihabitans tibetensis]PRY70607.1 exonuclease SbcC [Glaciihabitans tibetensis]